MATAEDTILSKLEWSKMAGGSARQLDDVRGLVDTQVSRLDIDYIDRWAPVLGVLDEWRAIAIAAALIPAG